MSILLALIIGAAVGTAGAFLLKDNFNLLAIDIIFGVAGSLLGLFFYVVSFGGADALGLFDPSGGLCMLIGALLFVLGFNSLHLIFPRKITKGARDEEQKEPDK